MAKYRFGRLGEEFKKEISTIIKDEVKDPRVGFVSVMDDFSAFKTMAGKLVAPATIPQFTVICVPDDFP